MDPICHTQHPFFSHPFFSHAEHIERTGPESAAPCGGGKEWYITDSGRRCFIYVGSLMAAQWTMPRAGGCIYVSKQLACALPGRRLRTAWPPPASSPGRPLGTLNPQIVEKKTHNDF
jgi:hypothetical protein